MTRLTLLALMSLPAAVGAQEARSLSYNYVEGSVMSSELNAGPLDADGDGIGIEGSVAVLPKFHIFGAYADEGFELDLDRTTLRIGAGYSYALDGDFHLVGRLSYIESDVDRPGFDTSETGLGIEAGVRGRIRERAELDAGVRYVDLRASDTSLFVDGRFFLRPELGVGGGLTSDDGDLTLTANVRFLFAD